MEWTADGFHLRNAEGNVQVQVYDLLGRRMFSTRRIVSDGVCDIPFIAKKNSGIYLLRVTTSGHDRVWRVRRQTVFNLNTALGR